VGYETIDQASAETPHEEPSEYTAGLIQRSLQHEPESEILTALRHIPEYVPQPLHEEPDYVPQPIVLDINETWLLARMIHSESHWECRLGKIAVGQTAIDRYESGRYGSTLTAVITAPNQFVVSRNRYGCSDCLEAAESVLAGERAMPEYSLLYFRSLTTHTSDWWAPYIDEIGAHKFYGHPR
jgi:spore germination cell wall hydrolase CwlJ-like protein